MCKQLFGYNFFELPAPLDPPTNVSVTNTSAHSLFVEWDPPNTPNGIVVNYTIYLDYNNGTTDVRITDFNTTAYLLEGLAPYQLVGIEITASTTAGEGPSSPVQEIRTHQAGTNIWISVLLLNFTLPVWNNPEYKY